MTVVGLAAVGAVLFGWIVLQIRIGSDRQAAREHEVAMLRANADARTYETADRLSQIRLEEAKALNGYHGTPELRETYARHYLGGAPVFEAAAKALAELPPSDRAAERLRRAR